MASGTSSTNLDTKGDVASDVAERLRFEALLSDLAGGFINLEPAQVDRAIEDCLRHIVEALGLDRSTLFQSSGGDLVATHLGGPGQKPLPEDAGTGRTFRGSPSRS